MAFAKNYTISNKEWTPLSDIMDQDYDHEMNYRIHINESLLFAGAYFKARLGFTHRTDTPETSDRGSEYTSDNEILVKADTGDDIYLRATSGDINIEIMEVA